MALAYLAGAWLAGIALAQLAGAPWWAWSVVALPSLLAVVLTRQRPQWRLASACALMLALGAARLGLARPDMGEGDLAFYNGQGFVTIEGVITGSPDVRDAYANLRVRAESIVLEDGVSRPVEGEALVQAPRLGVYHYGDPVRVRGELVAPPELDAFSYRDYLARKGVYSLVRYAQVEVTGERRGNPIWAAMFDFRERANRIIARLLPDPESALLSGILLGIESRISPEVREAFNAVGATHVIVISGSNLAILAGVIQSLARRAISRSGWVAAITIAGVAFYAVFVGGDAAVMRAAVMTTLGLVAAQLGRQTYGLVSLAFAALLMTAINPYLLWDASFQLSFLATLGLVLYVEPLQKLVADGVSRLLSGETACSVVRTISDPFVVTVAAQITTTPIIAYTFRRLSLLALPVNFLIIPAQTPIMVLGGLAVLAALIVPPVGQVLAWGSWLFLAWTTGVVSIFARLPYASLEISELSPMAILGIYGLIFGLTFYSMQRPERRVRQREWLRQMSGLKVLSLGGLTTAALLFAVAWSLPDGRLHVTFVDVGDGAATLIETPSGRKVLVDAGGSGRRLSTALGRALPYWDQRIDLLVITQLTPTHIAALPAITARYRFDAVIVNPQPGEPEVEASLEDLLLKRGTQRIAAQPGMSVRVGDGVELTVLRAQDASPMPVKEADSPVVLILAYKDVRILLAGDMTPEDEAALLNGYHPLYAAVLQVPRSGHRDLSSEAFLAAVSPQAAVISVGETNRSGLPHPEALERLRAAGTTVYRTDRDGTVWMISDGRRVWIRTER